MYIYICIYIYINIYIYTGLISNSGQCAELEMSWSPKVQSNWGGHYLI